MHPTLYGSCRPPYTASVPHMKVIRGILCAAVLSALCVALPAGQSPSPQSGSPTRESTEKSTKSGEKSQDQKAPEEKATAKPAAKLPAQIELLETHVRFESNGDSRKEVHARVHINDELGARQFARLNFSYNRAFQSVEIPLAHITHANGGTADVLPSAITDNPDTAVINFPAYQDVRVKSIRILGLAPDDVFEYRVVTTTTHHPLAPDFWFEHTFDRSGVTSHESLELDLPGSRNPTLRINPATPADSTGKTEAGNATYTTYQWNRGRQEAAKPDRDEANLQEPDIVLSTARWETLSIRLDERLSFSDQPLKNLGAYEETNDAPPKSRIAAPDVAAKAAQLTSGLKENRAKLEAIYEFVAQKIGTVDLPLGSTGFVTRPTSEILASGYATQEDKFALFFELASAVKLAATAGLTGYCEKEAPAQPVHFKRLLIATGDHQNSYWVDPSLEVAPFGVIPPNSGDCVFELNRLFFLMDSTGHEWQKLDAPFPFPAKQHVQIDATLSGDGTLKAHAKYVIRGENELLLRVAFHQSPRDKWDGVAQLLAVSDGFRGKASKTEASDPYDTHDPFSVSYEITQQKFLDWSKKPIRIPAILPLVGLPDPPENASAGGKPKPIELGTPLDVEVSATLHLPEGTGAEVPAGTSIRRDFATYESHYSVSNATLAASRHINFILKEISADRAAEYNAFLHAVQNDESQLFTLERASANGTVPPPRKP